MKIYDDIQAFAALKGAKLLLGGSYFRSLHGNRIVLADNQILLGADFNVQPQRLNGVVQSLVFSGLLMFGRKFEALTFASATETFEEKLNNRLNELTDIALQWTGEFACLYDYRIERENIIMQLNEFAQNIDFVATEITLVYE